IKIDFGNGKVALPSGWNNAGNAVKSNDIVLKDSKGVVTPVHLVTISSLKRINGNGTKKADPSLGFPVGATQDSFFGSVEKHGGKAEPMISYELRGLDPSRTYSFEFF